MRRLLRALAVSALVYTLGGALLPARVGRAGWTARVTYYVDTGYTASGEWTHDGGAGCSYDLPLGTVVRFVETGIAVTCNDRGLLSPTWIDVWAPNGWPQRVLGDWAEIEVQ